MWCVCVCKSLISDSFVLFDLFYVIIKKNNCIPITLDRVMNLNISIVVDGNENKRLYSFWRKTWA